MRKLVLLAAFTMIGVLLAATRSLAAQPQSPKIVPLDTVTVRPVEVGVSTKQLTLIHFEIGDVTMVAVGDTSMVNVTVKGPDVLVKALAFSGKTNAFIWVAGAYTQWVFTVRDSSTDPRVIIVREKVAEAGAQAGTSGKGPVTVTQAYIPPKEQKPAVQTKPAAPSVSSQKPATQAKQAAPPASSRKSAEQEGGPGLSPLDVFVKSLNKEQADRFAAFLKDPNLETLGNLLRVLNDQQRDMLMNMLISQKALIASGGKLTGTENEKQAQPAGKPAGTEKEKQTQTVEKADQPQKPSSAGVAPVMVAGVSTEVPEGVIFSVTPQVVGDRLFINYIFQNGGQQTLLADSLRLKIYDPEGTRLPYVITRTSETGYVGRLIPGGAEAGVISMELKTKRVVLEWTLVVLGTGEQLVVRATVSVP